MAEHTVRVRLEGESATLDAALGNTAKGGRAATASLGKTSRALTEMDTAAKKAATSVAQVATSKVKATQVATGLAKAAATAKGGLVDIGTAAAQAATAFGPWGAAIGLAAGALIGYISASDQAADATRKLKREMMQQNAVARDARRERELSDFKRRQASIEESQASQRKMLQDRQIADTSADLLALEDALAAHGRGRDTLALQREESRIRAENLRIQGDIAGAAQLERDFHLQTLELMNEKGAASRGRRGAVVQSEEFLRELSLARAANTAGALDRSDSRDFAAESARANAMQRAGSDTRGGPDPTAATLRAIELERAAEDQRVGFLGAQIVDHEAEMQRIDREKAARLDLLQTQYDASTIGAERADIAEEMEATRHESTLQRIAAEKSAEQDRIAMVQRVTQIGTAAAGQTVAGLVSIRDARVQATNAAKAQGATDREAARAGKIAAMEQTAGQLTALRNLAIQKAIEQTALGIGALASFNYPGAGLHFAAAATWGVVAGGSAIAARSIDSAASGMRGADNTAAQATGSTSAGGSPGGGGGGINDSPIPGSPSPQSPSVGGSASRGGRVYNLTFTGDVYGTPKREFIRSIDEGLDELGYQRTRKVAS